MIKVIADHSGIDRAFKGLYNDIYTKLPIEMKRALERHVVPNILLRLETRQAETDWRNPKGDPILGGEVHIQRIHESQGFTRRLKELIKVSEPQIRKGGYLPSIFVGVGEIRLLDSLKTPAYKGRTVPIWRILETGSLAKAGPAEGTGRIRTISGPMMSFYFAKLGKWVLTRRVNQTGQKGRHYFLNKMGKIYREEFNKATKHIMNALDKIVRRWSYRRGI